MDRGEGPPLATPLEALRLGHRAVARQDEIDATRGRVEEDRLAALEEARRVRRDLSEARVRPFIFYFIAGFIFPALRMKEKHYVYRGLGFGVFLFSLGVCFCYFILMPIALSASAMYSNWLGFEANQWRAEDYISFVCKFMLGMGIGFQMPVVLLTLVKIGVLNYTILSKMRRYMIVVNLVLGALLTTPEVITQVMMAIPLQLLYEISVWIAWFWERRDKKRSQT